MITKEFLNPESIVVVGGSDDFQKPGGKVLKNLKDTGYPGKLYVVNPKADNIQGLTSYRRVEDVPRGRRSHTGYSCCLLPAHR